MRQALSRFTNSVPRSFADLRTQRDGTFFNAVLLLSAFTTAGFFNYLYHFIVGRLLAPDDYAVVVSFIALTVTLTAPFGVTQTVLADFSSLMLAQNSPGKITYVLRKIFLMLGAASIMLSLIVFAARNTLSNILHTQSIFVAVVLVLSLTATLGVPALLGVAQAGKRYWVVSIARVLSAAGRLIISVPFCSASSSR